MKEPYILCMFVSLSMQEVKYNLASEILYNRNTVS